MDPDRLLDDLNDGQRRAVTSTAAPLCVLAGAGSGKTRVLTRRIAYRVATGDADPRRVLALTFTRKAAGELTQRLRALEIRDRVAAGTFHAVALAQLRGRWADRNVTPPDLLDRKVGFVARLLPRGAYGPTAALDVVGEIEWAKARRIGPELYPGRAAAANRKSGKVPAAVVAEVFDRYESEKQKRRLVDFDDLLRLCIRDLENDRSFAEAQRWRFRHLFVDEYQDVNPLQHALLSAWLGERVDLCVVGDANQAIYGWNGADPDFILKFPSHQPTAEVVRLVDNYRSSPEILAAATAVLAEGERIGELPAGSALELRANRSEGPRPKVIGYGTGEDEARGLARAVRDRHKPGRPWSDIAVLVRTNAQTAPIAEAFEAAGIPSRVKGGSGLLDEPEVKAWLRQLANHRGAFDTVLADLEESARDGDPALEALAAMARDFVAVDPSPSGAGFVAWMRAAARSEQATLDADAVEIATFHGAKGLEWPVVFVAGCEEGFCPIGYAQTTEQLAEERRLFYVAVTRAEQELVCTWAAGRVFGTREDAKPRRREASAYLDDIRRPFGGVPAEAGRDRAAATARTGVRTARGARERKAPVGVSSRAELDDTGQALFDALKTWRSDTARMAGVPAYIVCNDRTLLAVARSRPATAEELLTVPGFGPVKVERYGEAVLAVVAGQQGATVAE